MSTINIDDKIYELDSLSENARAQLDMLIIADKRIEEIKRDLAIVQTARVAYAHALSDALPKFEGDTIKIS